MVVVPNTNIILLKTPFEMDEENTLTFANATAQYNYFISLPKLELDNATYQRKDGVIRWAGSYDDIIEYNYCMYQNESFSNKWFYAFIEDIKFVSTEVTEIKIKTDVFETWQFDIVWKQTFIEREHVSKANDGYGKNLVEEKITFKEYFNMLRSDFNFGDCHPVMATTVSPIDGSNVGGGVYGGIPSGSTYYVFQQITDLFNGLTTIANAGKSSGIVSVFLAPDWLTGYNTATFISGVAEVPITTYQTDTTGIAVPLNPTVIGSYTPVNKKVFTYPYCYYVLSNNSGTDVILKLEDFKDDGTHTGSIDIIGAVCPSCSIRAIPVDYEVGNATFADGQNNQYGVNLGKFPICSFPVDSYTNWLTQNAVNIPLSIASGVISTATGIIGGNPISSASGLISIAQNIGSIYEHSLIPPSVSGNTNSGDITYSSGKLTFTGYLRTIKEEQAKILDNYFSMYGYQTNRLKLPNLNTRSNWNFVKTINCNITGNIPQKDLLEIKGLFNRGITLWHNASTFLDYSQANN